MARKLTKEIRYIRLPEKRIREIEDLVASWPYETKSFMRSRLSQYRPPSDFLNSVLDFFLSFFVSPQEKDFSILKDPEILTDWQRRFELSGQSNPQEAWNKLLEKEVSARDYRYLTSLLDSDLTDVHIPLELRSLFEKVYRAHIRKEYVSDPAVPKAPIILITGPTGSGKTSTVTEAIQRVIFRNEVLPEIDLNHKKEELLAKEPFWRTIEEVEPGLSEEIRRRKKLKFYKRLSRTPLLGLLLRKTIARHLSQLEEQGVLVDYAMVTPNDYQTALAGEPGNYFKKAMGDPRKTAIRHVEEAHSAFGKAEGRDSGGAERQQRTLIDTSNILMDEIIGGKRDCLLIATSDQPERFDSAIYRRFVERGKIIDMADFWKNRENMKEIIRLELLRNDIRTIAPADTVCPSTVTCLSLDDMDLVTDQVYRIFGERSLKIIPAYVRKLIHSVLEIKGTFSPEYLDDSLLVRRAFELVARNSYGDLFGKVVNRMDRNVPWEAYVGSVKNTFSEMANNCLFYGVSDEKGVVLKGPPGGGKTFLVRAWLSENKDVHDISTHPSALQDPANPIDGAVENLEKVYDIAKMIAPTVVFFDEGDALAPKRSTSGGAPSDKLTNKFLNLIDGEIPLNKVFTVMTTNRIDILDPALIRSKRLKVSDITGQLRPEDIAEIIRQSLENIPLDSELSADRIMEFAKGICNTPADYSAFVHQAMNLRSTEFEVILRLKTLSDASPEAQTNFIKFNFKTLIGILEALNLPQELRDQVKSRPNTFMEHYEEILNAVETVADMNAYPLQMSHLVSTREELSQSPTRKGKVQLDEFLEAELSQEPQVGFIIGVGANDVSGVLLPIATSLTYSLSADKVLVTGAVSSASSAAAELDMAVQMTQQSAKEALTMVKNYLQGLNPKVSMPRLLGEFLEKYTLHHQLLTASYSVGGPSAGYALALNTLSAMLHIPIYNDFGITGAPWTKGVKKGEVGGSVIIGGHKKKTEKVLQYLRRMYMPLQNYKDLENEFLAAYWHEDKDVLGVTNFGELVPEVVWLGPDYEQTLLELIALRIRHKLWEHDHKTPDPGIEEKILENKEILKTQLEDAIRQRLDAIRRYLRSPARDPHLSLEEIFRPRKISEVEGIRPLVHWMKRFRGNKA